MDKFMNTNGTKTTSVNEMPKCEQLGYEHIKDVATNGMERLCSLLREIVG